MRRARVENTRNADSGNSVTHPDDDDNCAQGHHPKHRSLEPHFAILQIEAHVDQITNEVWLARNILAETSSD